LFDPGEGLLEEISGMQSNAGRLQFSVERTGGGNRSYYYAGRFMQAPRFLAHYGCPIAISDIDCVFRDNIAELIAAASDADLGILETRSYPYPWQNFRANLVVFNSSEASLRYALAIQHFLRQVQSENANYWFIDQAALVECVYLQRKTGFGRIADIGTAYNSLCYQPTGGTGRPAEKAQRARDATV